jgi:hypothetical protein
MSPAIEVTLQLAFSIVGGTHDNGEPFLLRVQHDHSRLGRSYAR